MKAILTMKHGEIIRTRNLMISSCGVPIVPHLGEIVVVGEDSYVVTAVFWYYEEEVHVEPN